MTSLEMTATASPWRTVLHEPIRGGILHPRQCCAGCRRCREGSSWRPMAAEDQVQSPFGN